MAQTPSAGDPEALLNTALALVEIPSVSHNEGEISDYLENELSGLSHLQLDRIGDNLIARTQLGRPDRLLLGGHTDTVFHPPENYPRRENDNIKGPGAVDMKGGLAVFLELAKNITQSSLDLSYLFYAREEVELIHSGLREVDSARPELLKADAAILGEPTGGAIEAGCQGTLRVKLSIAGIRAHTARAWKGKNAIHRLYALLAALDSYEPRRPVIDKCEYVEALQAVSIGGGVAGNVVPDRADITLNMRFAPDRDSESALAEIQDLAEAALNSKLQKTGDIQNADITEEGDTIQILDLANPAPPSLDCPVFKKLTSQVGEVRAKLGWTDVAFFSERGVPALNFGPGDPEIAHTAKEEVSVEELVFVYEALADLIAG